MQSHQSDSEQTLRRARNGSSNSENLAAAVANMKQRSRRKAPLILLIAFALAAVAGTAYAAYTIISKITAPENTQQAQDSAQSAEEPETYVADTKEAAIEAYSKVIADYDSVAGLKESDVDLSEHPYLNPESPIESSYAIGKMTLGQIYQPVPICPKSSPQSFAKSLPPTKKKMPSNGTTSNAAMLSK